MDFTYIGLDYAIQMYGQENEYFNKFLPYVAFPITREKLRTFSPDPVYRQIAIDNAVNHLTFIILFKASTGGTSTTPYTNNCVRVGNKLSIPRATLSQYEYQRSTVGATLFTSTKIVPDIVPEVIEKLKQIFTDVGFSRDEFTGNIIVDWS